MISLKIFKNVVSCISVKNFHFQDILGNIQLELLKERNAYLSFGNSHEKKLSFQQQTSFQHVYICV